MIVPTNIVKKILADVDQNIDLKNIINDSWKTLADIDWKIALINVSEKHHQSTSTNFFLDDFGKKSLANINTR